MRCIELDKSYTYSMYTSMPLLLGFSTVKMGSKVGIFPLEGSSTVHYLCYLRDKFKLSQKKKLACLTVLSFSISA